MNLAHDSDSDTGTVRGRTFVYSCTLQGWAARSDTFFQGPRIGRTLRTGLEHPLVEL